MSMTEKAAGVTPPYESKNLIVLASSASSSRVKLPASWRRSIITIQAEGVDLWVCFGGTSASAVKTAVTTLTSEAPSAQAAGLCQYIPAGQQRDFDLSLIVAKNPGNTSDIVNTRLAWIASATGGYVRIIRSSGPVDEAETGLA